MFPYDFPNFPSLRPGQLSALLIQKEIKLAKKLSFRIRNNQSTIARMWFSGRSFVDIASKFGLLPMAVAYALRNDLRYTRKDFQRIIAENSERRIQKREKETKDQRVGREISEACAVDTLHSPWALRYMKEKGQLGELAAETFLRKHGLDKFATEKEQDKGGKTPDFLFDKIEKIPGTGFEGKWFESKATFGSLSEVREDNRTQLTFYTKIFGAGAIVYWLGISREAKEFLENANGERSILVLSGEDLRADVSELLDRLLDEGMRPPK